MLQIGKFLVGKSSSLPQWAGRELPTDRTVLIRESTLEGHQHMAAVVDVFGDFFRECVVRNIEGGNDEQLILREFGCGHGGKNEVAAEIGHVKGSMKLCENGVVRSGRFTRDPSRTLLAFEGHKLDSIGGVDAVEDRDVVVDFHVGQFGADLLEFVRDASKRGVSAVGLEV